MEIPPRDDVFPRLSDDEMQMVEKAAACVPFQDGEIVFQPGEKNLPFLVVTQGTLEIQNPADQDAVVARHGPAEFAGDVDLLTGRSVVVRGIARGETVLLQVPAAEMRRLLVLLPRLGEKLITAFALRRRLLEQSQKLGVVILGEAVCSDTTLIREFLHKNFVPHTWYDSGSEEGTAMLRELQRSPADCPLVVRGRGEILSRPTLRSVADQVGMPHHCPTGVYELAIVGAGPAGMTAAVYSASEGLSTVIMDRLGPGGQTSASSMIENFIGFPSGLSGTELATRGVLQMLKFGALLLSPFEAKSLRRGGDCWEIKAEEDEIVRARCVLLAVGVRWKKLRAPGAERFERSGIYYAATSLEATLCAGEDVVVVGAGNSGGQAALYLSECARRVHMLVRGPALAQGMSTYLSERIKAAPRVQVYTDLEVAAVNGSDTVHSVEVVGKNGVRSCIPCKAIFVFIGAVPHTEWLPPELGRDAQGYVLTGVDAAESGLWRETRHPCPLETTLPGVLGAGDVRSGTAKRVGFAVGDGSMAVACAHKLRNLAGRGSVG